MIRAKGWRLSSCSQFGNPPTTNTALFLDQLKIAGVAPPSSADKGDSGSIVLDYYNYNFRPLGLLVAGDKSFAHCNKIENVCRALNQLTREVRCKRSHFSKYRKSPGSSYQTRKKDARQEKEKFTKDEFPRNPRNPRSPDSSTYTFIEDMSVREKDTDINFYDSRTTYYLSQNL